MDIQSGQNRLLIYTLIAAYITKDMYNINYMTEFAKIIATKSHIWYFEKYQFEVFEPLCFSYATL